MNIIDISYWKPEQITEIAGELLKKVSGKTRWNWKIEYHRGSDNSDGEPFHSAHWTIEGESKRHKLSIMMYLGNVPWIIRWKLHFTKNGKDYAVLEEIFGKFPELKELEIKLDSIGRELKKKQDIKKQKQQRRESQQYQRKQNQEAKELVASMRRK
ncbi:MAG: hypothetical protein HYT62_03015 [Candidatus Yanofskybacteria bacterium]|nr:hypothetical protein [Candidatus Yanofskybacteria bacterium]